MSEIEPTERLQSRRVDRNRRWSRRAVVSSIAAVALVLGYPLSASAGTRTTYMTQVQPTFASSLWYDDNSSSTVTKVVLTACKGNKGGQTPNATYLTSVKLTLYKENFTTADTALKSVTKYPCGTFDFGKRLPGWYYFKVSAINGVTTFTPVANQGTFMNADVLIQW